MQKGIACHHMAKQSLFLISNLYECKSTIFLAATSSIVNSSPCLNCFTEVSRCGAVSVFEVGVEGGKIGKTYKFGDVDHFHIGGHK